CYGYIIVHIKNLRNKLIKACGDACIHTEWGRGYRFER
ncbi:MAG TPA: DNA-binding response regulator, partial [Eubacterium sp.]|nr:DNA-binding response regulator [Eubacterium sp.]